MAHKLLKTAPQSYTSWATGHPLTGGPDDDDDNDGLSNFHEYTTATPQNATSGVRAEHGSIMIGSDEYLTVNLRRSLNTLGVDYTPQYSEDLVNWNTLGTPALIQSTHNGDGTATLQYRAPFKVMDKVKMFLRYEMKK